MSAGVGVTRERWLSVLTGMEDSEGSSSRPMSNNGSPATTPRNQPDVLRKFFDDKRRVPNQDAFFSMVHSKSFEVKPSTDPESLIEVVRKVIINEPEAVTYDIPVPYVLAHADILRKMDIMAAHFGRRVEISSKASTMKICLSARPPVEEVDPHPKEIQEMQEAHQTEKDPPNGYWY